MPRLIAALKKYNGIDEAEYLRMDREDVMNALSLSGMSEEALEWVFEADDDPENRPSVIYKKGMAKKG